MRPDSLRPATERAAAAATTKLETSLSKGELCGSLLIRHSLVGVGPEAQWVSRGAMAVTEATLRLPPSLEAALTAREFVIATLVALGCEIDEAVMVMSNELIVNAVEHAKSRYEVRIVGHADRVRVGVRDWSDKRTVVCDPSLDSTSGRGLRLVAELAAKWGIEPAERGKTVWFEIDCQ
jgi:hypothetical protein